MGGAGGGKGPMGRDLRVIHNKAECGIKKRVKGLNMSNIWASQRQAEV